MKGRREEQQQQHQCVVWRASARKQCVRFTIVIILQVVVFLQQPCTAFQPSSRLNPHRIRHVVTVLASDRLRVGREPPPAKMFSIPEAATVYPRGNDQKRILEERSGATPVQVQLSDADKQQKNVILGLLWITACLSALDRVAMAVALVPMSAELDYTDSVKGSISSLLSIGYGLSIIPAGLMVGCLPPRMVMMCGIAMWSMATIATPMAAGAWTTMVPLLIARACVGAGESIVYPATQRFLAVWTSSDEKSTALAFVNSGFQAGTIAAYLLSPWIMEVSGGWSELFVLYGNAGLVVLIPWLVLARDDPVVGKALSPTDSAVIEQQPRPQDILRDVPWKDMMQSKAVWGMILAHCSRNWHIYNAMAWMPTFYAEQYDVGIKESAWLSMLPSIAGAIGGFVAGRAADSVVHNLVDDDNKGLKKTEIRKCFQTIGLVGPALMMAGLSLHIPEQTWVTQGFLASSFALLAFSAGGFEAANQEKAGQRWSGLLYSLTSLPGVLFGTLGVYLTGCILDGTGQDWGIVFGLNAFINILGAMAFIALYDSQKEFD